jgi:hypothetical protein
MSWNHISEAARRKLEKNENWYAFRVEVIDTGYEVEGGPSVVDDAGRRHWAKTPRDETTVTKAEVEAQQIRYEKEKGKCSKCNGDGKVATSWHHLEGNTFKPCPACDGTGKVKGRKGRLL